LIHACVYHEIFLSFGGPAEGAGARNVQFRY
jgi:hypothetical protein